MAVVLRTRQHSHPPPGEEELPPPEPTVKSAVRRTKSGYIDSEKKAGKHLARVKTMMSYDKKRKPVANMSSLNIVTDMLTCKLCSNRLRRPKMLPCQHTFCMVCLQEKVQPSDKVIKCSVCGQEAKMKIPGSDGIAELPPNLYLDSLLTAIQQEPNNTMMNHDENARCVKCQTVGTTPCQHCRQALCTVCWPGHITELKSQFPSLLDQLKAAEQSLDHYREEFQDVCEKVKERIDAAVEVKIQTILEEEKRLKLKAGTIQETSTESYKELTERLKQAENKILSAEDFNSIADNNKVVGEFMQLHRMTSNLLQEVSHWGDTRPMFNPETFDVEVGDTKKSNNGSEDNDDVFYEEDIQNVDSPDTLSLYYRSRSFTPRINLGKSVLKRPGGVGIAPWDNGTYLYIAGSEEKQVLVIDCNRMKLVHQLTASCMLYPHGIAFSKSVQEVYVSDKWNHCIHVFNAEGVYQRQLGKKGHSDGLFHSPEGIAADEHYIYVCDTGNDRVQVLNPEDGSVVRIVGILDPLPGSKYKRTEFNQPTDIAVSQDRIVIADMGNKRIKIYSLAGKRLQEFGSMGVRHGQFQTPECVALDRLGFILVGDSTTSRVQIFRPDGTLIRVFGGKGSSPGKFARISGIAVRENMDIIVTDSKNGSVQIF